jgi:hypothetical protein
VKVIFKPPDRPAPIEFSGSGREDYSLKVLVQTPERRTSEMIAASTDKQVDNVKCGSLVSVGKSVITSKGLYKGSALLCDR